MRPESYRSEELVKLLRKHKIATLPELKAALGTSADATVFRKLAELAYRSSYSHRGRYYTLDELAEFDEWGLWTFRSVWFSQRGTLIATVKALAEESEAGMFASELKGVLHVEVKGALLRLVQERRLNREQVYGRFLYCSTDPSTRREQMATRRVLEARPLPGGGLIRNELMPDELKAAIVLFFSMLDEKQSRLYAGLESLKLGHGGDRRVADLLTLDVGTVARGRSELLTRDVELDRVRRAGAGRKALEKKLPKSSSESKS